MTTINCPAGFFQDDAVTPVTITDLLTAVASAQSNVNNALTSEENAAASATAAASSATAAAGSANSASSSATAASNSATSASASASTATTQASNAASSATSASTSAGNASTSASNAATSATNASGSVTAAANSASAAATSATNAANSASAASASQAAVAAAVGTIPTPGVGNKLAMIRINSGGTAYESQTPAQVATNIGALNDVGRNKIHNSQFNVAQRGLGPFTTGGYTLDRWTLAFNADTVSVSQVALGDVQRTQIGDEEAVNGVAVAVTGNASASAFSLLAQPIEYVFRLSNKPVTISFWAYATAGTPKIGVGLRQSFGTGGSPSANVDINATPFTLSTTATRYSMTVTLPSTAGKTFGTNGGDYTRLAFFFSSGANNNTLAGGIGVQSATFVLWGVQLEVGSIMTPLEKLDPAQDLTKCQRFYQTGLVLFSGTGTTGGGVFVLTSFPVTMRAQPAITAVTNSSTNVTSSTVLPSTGMPGGAAVGQGTITGTGAYSINITYAASADL